MRSEKYSLLGIMAATYVVTIGVLWHERRAPFPAPAAYIAAAPVFRPAVGQPAPGLAMQPAEVDPSAARVPMAPPHPATNDGPAPNTDGPELPITLDIVRSTVSINEEGPDGAMRSVHKDVNEAIISNESDQVLTISAIDVNSSTQESTQAEFVLGHNGQKHLNLDDGLNLSSGDQLTLRSASFRDRTQQIP